MVLTLIVGLVLGGAAVALALRAIAMPRIAAASRIGEIQAYGFAGTATPDQEGDRRGGLDRIADAVGRALAARSSRFQEAEIRTQLMTAGLYTTAPMTFLGYRVLAAVVGGGTMLWLCSASGSSGLMLVAGTTAMAAAGWTIPMTVVRRRGELRLEKIESDLPELIDLLVVTVEAGLGFNRSLQIASQRFKGPLADELRLTLQEQRMGLSTNASLTNMLSRAETPSMRSFVRSILQGETLGVSIGTIMRNLATETRKRRRQTAEERAHKAPIKMLFPLILLMFPSLFIVLLYPALYTFVQTFGT
jgi:tight adherence protein C